MKHLLLITAILLSISAHAQFNKFKIPEKKEVVVKKKEQKGLASKTAAPTRTADYHYQLAQKKKGHLAVTEINKAIAIEPNNLDYRKLRAQKLMTDGAQKEALLLAIDDLTFVANNGGEHYKVYGGIATCYMELSGETLRLKTPEIKKDPFGDNTAYINAYKEIDKERIAYYNKALIAISKGADLGAEKHKVDNARQSILEKISKLEKEMNELKD